MFSICGVMCCFPGIALTSIGFAIPRLETEQPIPGFVIAGSILLTLGGTIILGSAARSLFQDWKSNTPNSSSWNSRVRMDSKALGVIFEVVGLILGLVGFGTNTTELIAAGCCILGFAFTVMLLGLLLSRFGKFDNSLQSTDNAPVPSDDAPRETTDPSDPDPPPPNSTPNSAKEDTNVLPVHKDLDIIGWALLFPGLLFSCICWIKPYSDPYRIVGGTIGAVCLTTGGLLLIIGTTMRLCINSSLHRPALYRIFVMSFLCGIVMTPVGFVSNEIALGVVGACLLGIAVVSCFCNRPTCQTVDESPGNAELGQVTFTSVFSRLSQNINVTTTGSNQTTLVSYPPPGVNVEYPPSGTNPVSCPNSPNSNDGQCQRGGCFYMFSICGVMCCFPGIALTSIGFAIPRLETEQPIPGFVIAGSILLTLGGTIILGSAARSLFQDWKSNTPNSSSWNSRVRMDSKALGVIFEVVGLILGLVGFGTNTTELIAAGCCILGFAFTVMLLGLLLSRFGKFDNSLQSTDNAPVPSDDAPRETTDPSDPDPPPPNSTPNSAKEDTNVLPVHKDLDIIGWALLFPGLLFSCICWIKPYSDPYRIVGGTIGAVCLTTGGLLLIIGTTMRLCINSSLHRPALYRIFVMSFLCGIVMTPVGFVSNEIALGVVGACLLGIAVVSCFCNRPTCQTVDESPGNAELGQVTFTSVFSRLSQNINVTTTGSNQTTLVSYPPPGVNVEYPPSGTNPAYPPGCTNPVYPPPGTDTANPPPGAGSYPSAGVNPAYVHSSANSAYPISGAEPYPPRDSGTAYPASGANPPYPPPEVGPSNPSPSMDPSKSPLGTDTLHRAPDATNSQASPSSVDFAHPEASSNLAQPAGPSGDQSNFTKPVSLPSLQSDVSTKM